MRRRVPDWSVNSTSCSQGVFGVIACWVAGVLCGLGQPVAAEVFSADACSVLTPIKGPTHRPSPLIGYFKSVRGINSDGLSLPPLDHEDHVWKRGESMLDDTWGM